MQAPRSEVGTVATNYTGVRGSDAGVQIRTSAQGGQQAAQAGQQAPHWHDNPAHPVLGDWTVLARNAARSEAGTVASNYTGVRSSDAGVQMRDHGAIYT